MQNYQENGNSECFKLSEIDLSTVNLHYVSYSDRKGVYQNKYLIEIFPFAIKMSLIDEKVRDSVHKSWILYDKIFNFHHMDYRDKKVDIDPCDIYEKIIGKVHGSQDISLTDHEYFENKNKLLNDINEALMFIRNEKIEKVIN